LTEASIPQGGSGDPRPQTHLGEQTQMDPKPDPIGMALFPHLFSAGNFLPM
jgi:hypothetical protein